MKKIIEVSCIGLGQRGCVYLDEMKKMPDKFKIVAGCDNNQERLDRAENNFNISKDNLFLDEDDFFQTKRGDLCIVSTQDKDHVRHAIKALRLGYDVLCEKPISDQESEVRALLDEQRKANKKVFICHVLRYAPAFRKVKELLDEGTIGDLVSIDSIENVQYLHYCHSYVRGIWRNSSDAAPMILAKCCHDLDIIAWYANSECENISSIGDLRFFKPENKPYGASNRCMDCKYRGKCAFDAYSSYITQKFWGRWLITDERPLTDELIEKTLDKSPFGRCVFACDNNVVDNQLVMMKFKNGVTAQLRMLAFTYYGGRVMKFYGTKGEIDLNESEGKIDVMPFGKIKETIAIDTLLDTTAGHGGGDAGLVQNLYDNLTNNVDDTNMSTLKASTESHLMGFAAEESRLHNGKVIEIKHQ